MLNALTIDVEDYYQVTAFEHHVQRRQWDDYASRVVPNTHRLLDLLDRRQTRATFFIMGYIGRRHPELVRDIARAGHEVGCHSFWHRRVYHQTPEEFRDDLKAAQDVLEDALGGPVTAYRAPSFSITKQSLWALEILSAEGFRYDSSIFPVYHDRYGIPGAERFPYRIPCSQGDLWEFPPSVHRVAKMNVPVAGGGYFRLYPLWWTLYCLRQINRQGQPAIFYVHPWELDPEQPRMPLSLWTRWRHYLNLSSTERKLDGLLSRCRFGSLSDVLEQCRHEVRTVAWPGLGPTVREPEEPVATPPPADPVAANVLKPLGFEVQGTAS